MLKDTLLSVQWDLWMQIVLGLLDFSAGDTNKISCVDLEARKANYAEGIEKLRKITKAEQSLCGPDIPAEMDGGLKIKYILQKYDKEIRAEIECQGILISKPYAQLSMMEKKNLLKVDKMKNLAVHLKAREGIQPSDVKQIAPQSAEMLALVVALNS